MNRSCVFAAFSAMLLVGVLIHPSVGFSASAWNDVLRHVPMQWREDVGKVLDLAASEINDQQLVEALTTYAPGTSKHRAVCFLVAQMDKHLYVDYVNPDDPLNPFSPEDDSVEWRREYVWDYSTMTAELLIENVEWAFKAREEFPWCRALPESVFFEYVLPYRSTQEPLHSWRPGMYAELAPMISSLRSAREVALAINRHNTDRMHFDPLYYRHPEDRDIWTCLAAGAGRCEDMSNVSNYSLRAVGVPTASDFTPWWPKGDNNHAWNTVYDSGTWYQFMGCEAREVSPWNAIMSSTFAKVWRKSFSADPIMGPAPDGTMPPRLMRVAAIDVTADYSTVSDIELEVENPARATYLCVHNYGTWRSVAGAWAEDGKVRFPDVGNRDILYCPTRYEEDETGWGMHIPVGCPLVLHQDGSTERVNLAPQAEGIGDIVVTGWRDGSALEAASEVTLFRYIEGTQDSSDGSASVWDTVKWNPLESVTVADEGETLAATFAHVAVEGGLYILSDSDDPESLREGSRPFVWSSGQLIYY